jgi:hypothetical protein
MFHRIFSPFIIDIIMTLCMEINMECFTINVVIKMEFTYVYFIFRKYQVDKLWKRGDSQRSFIAILYWLKKNPMTLYLPKAISPFILCSRSLNDLIFFPTAENLVLLQNFCHFLWRSFHKKKLCWNLNGIKLLKYIFKHACLLC